MKKKYSPHISIKRLRDLAEEYTQDYLKGTQADRDRIMFINVQFINYVERNRASLAGRTKKK